VCLHDDGVCATRPRRFPCEINRALYSSGCSVTRHDRRGRTLTRIRNQRSILDSVTQKARQLVSALGSGSRPKLEQYLEAVRDVERRIQTAEKQSAQLPAVEQPSGVPPTFEEHIKLMFDLQVLAYQCDLTRL